MGGGEQIRQILTCIYGFFQFSHSIKLNIVHVQGWGQPRMITGLHISYSITITKQALNFMTTNQPLTWCLCPILCARAWACKSFWGFQSESKMMTVSAVARLIPRPPARVDNRKQKSFKKTTKPTISSRVKHCCSLIWETHCAFYAMYFFLILIQSDFLGNSDFYCRSRKSD